MLAGCFSHRADLVLVRNGIRGKYVEGRRSLPLTIDLNGMPNIYKVEVKSSR